MEKKCLLEEINSVYLIENIFSFTKDSFKYKLCLKSNKLKNKLKLYLSDYIYLYVKNKGKNLNKDDYLYVKEKNLDKYNKNELNIKLEEDLKKYNIDKKDLYKFIYYSSIKDYEKKEILRHIDIFSPFIDDLSQEIIFKKYYIIEIPINLIRKYNIKKDYIFFFEKLNKLNSNYSNISFECNDEDDFNYLICLKDFKIKFNQITNIDINQKYIPKPYDDDDDNSIDYGFDSIININPFFETVFSIENIKNNLINLVIFLDSIYELDPFLFENINLFKNLQTLSLKRFKFKGNFTLKLQNMKSLILCSCENISFEEKCCLNLINLVLICCIINKSKSLIEMPNLREYHELCDKSFNDIINFTTLTKVKEFEGKISDFINVNSYYLEKVMLSSDSNTSFEIEKKAYEMLLSSNKIKTIKIPIKELTIDEISKMVIDNYSVTELTIEWNNVNSESRLDIVQNRFHYLEDLSINSKETEKEKIILDEIEENEKCLVKKINLKGGNKILKLRIKSFEDLVEANIDIRNLEIKNNSFNDKKNLTIRKYSFPAFDSHCKVTFKSLIKFTYCSYNLDLAMFNNLSNNLAKMPNLKTFIFKSVLQDINQELYDEFIRNVLFLNLVEVNLLIRKKKTSLFFSEDDRLYNENELRQICPNTNIKEFKEIKILKLSDK